MKQRVVKVLLIDDNAPILFVMQRALELRGYDVHASHSYDGLSAVESVSPDLIFLDVALGTLDGCLVSQELKQNPATSAIPIILLTGHSNGKELATRAGADNYLIKPIGLINLWDMAAKYTPVTA